MARQVTEYGVETWVEMEDPPAEVSEYGVEVWYTYTAASPTTITGVGVTGYGVETWYELPDAELHVTEYGVEVWFTHPTDTIVVIGQQGTGVTTSFGYAG